MLSYPLLGHFIFVRVSHLDVVAEYIVESHLQTWYSGAFALALLQTQQIVLARIAYLTQFIEFVIHAVAYHIAAIEQIRGIGIDFASYAVANELAQIELLAYAAKHLAIACFAQAFNGLDGCQCGSQLHQFAWCDATYSHFRHQSLEVAYGFELLL